MAISMHIITADMEDIMNGEMRLEDGRIDLTSLAETMWKQGRRFWWLLLLLAGIGAAACSFLVKKTYQPVYTAFAAYAVSSDSVYAGNKNYEQKVAEQIGVVFPYILTSDVLREKVCEKMGTKTMPGSIDASVVQDTNLITIRARAASAGRAYELLQAVLACYPEILHPVTGVLKMELLDESGVPHQPDNIPDGRRAALEGAAGGSLLFILIVLFGAMAKKTVRNREDLGRIIKEAFYIARTGRPGPVLIDLPKDVMAELGSAEYPKNVNIRGYKPNTDVHIGQLKRAIKLLNKAKRPLFLAGGGVVISRAHEIFREVVEKTKVPVVTTVMGKGSIPTDHPLYIGNLGMHGAYAANMAVSNCDVLFSIGTRFNDRITGKLHEFAPHAQIIHIDIDTASISRNIQVDIPIVADAKEAITKMNEYVQECSTDKWLNLIKNWKEEHPLKMRPNDLLSPMDILKEINEQFENSIIVTDVGQHQMLVSQYAEITEGKQMIMSGGLGTMGYGLPGGIGAKIGNPDRPVIVISGDGGVQMNIQELATAVLEELPVILCIFNNEYLGMVRQWQKLFYGKRYAMTNLRAGALSRRTEGMEYPQYTPDFIKLAESYRAKGIRVTKKEEIAAAFEEAKKNTKAPTVIEFIIDPEEMVYPMIKPGGTLEDMIMDC